jgi:hypothetical protein
LPSKNITAAKFSPAADAPFSRRLRMSCGMFLLP